VNASDLSVSLAGSPDAPDIASLRNQVSADLTRRFGKGHWSSAVSDAGVARGIDKTSRVLVARQHGRIVATLRLTTKKPWAIDPVYFAAVARPLYLLDMVVEPALQRQGVGRHLLSSAAEIARDWPADAIRLDAYDSPAGAGPFYAKCGYAEVGRVTFHGVPLIYFERLL
jgi:GNAT superfamily N-acetyltransferase